MLGANDAVGEDKIDDVKDRSSSSDKYVAGYTKTDIVRVKGPRHTKRECSKTAHAETEGHRRHYKEMAMLSIELENRHVKYCADEIEE
jgi:hypothetical protein